MFSCTGLTEIMASARVAVSVCRDEDARVFGVRPSSHSSAHPRMFRRRVRK